MLPSLGTFRSSRASRLGGDSSVALTIKSFERRISKFLFPTLVPKGVLYEFDRELLDFRQ